MTGLDADGDGGVQGAARDLADGATAHGDAHADGEAEVLLQVLHRPPDERATIQEQRRLRFAVTYCSICFSKASASKSLTCLTIWPMIGSCGRQGTTNGGSVGRYF